MNKTEGFRRIGLFLGTLSSVMWTGYVAWSLLPSAGGMVAFEWLVFFFIWAIGLLVTFFVPVGLVTGIGWVVSGFQQND